MDIERYRQRLLAMEQQLRNRIRREAETGSETVGDQADVGDRSLAVELKEESFTLAEGATELLKQVEDALARIANGTFGRCVVDGKPIEEKRLEAVPWTPYCLKHAEQSSAATAVRTPTL
jgi:DnaK suppressor protein